MTSAHNLRQRYLAMVVLLVLISAILGSVLAFAQSGSVVASATPSNATPDIGEQITVEINIDVSAVEEPDDRLGSFTASLDWDPAMLAYHSNSGILAGFTGVVNTANVASGRIVFNGANPSGATNNVTVLIITFDVVGAGTSDLDLEFSAMAAAYTFRSLLPILTVNDGQVVVSPGPDSDGDGVPDDVDNCPDTA
ncbi:MAG: hypothetical protein H5T62_15310, partial [Anaerolineae bacterium]|nr:hypothetical protein [Anaerolineae bacterium]